VARRLSGVGLALQHRERARLESLDAKAQPVDAAFEPCGQPSLVGARRVRLQRDLDIAREVEVAADEAQQPRHHVRWQEARRAAAEVNGLQPREPVLLTRRDELTFEGVDIVRHESIHPRIRVEIAIAALVLAEGDVDVEVRHRLHVRAL
jgi:post-segregation antitoxin (ccd killing protein)